MENAFYYTYETVNFTKMKYYIGQHCTTDLNDGYFGSCKELKNDIKNGDEYEVNVVAHYKNIYDLGHSEFCLIKERNCIKDSDYYNKVNYLYFNNAFEYGLSEKTKALISKAQEGNKRTLGKHWKLNYERKSSKGYFHSEEAKQNMRKPKSEEARLKCIGNKNGTGKRSEETKQKMRHPHKPISEEGRHNMSEGQKGRIPWNKGLKLKLK